MILTASGYSGGGAFIFLHAPSVVAGAFLFPAVCRVAFSVPLYGVFLSGYILSIPFYVSSRVRPVWRSCGYPSAFPPGIWCFQRLYIARLRRSGMPIAAPYCSPCRASAAPLRPWAGCTLAPAAPEGATPQAVPVSGRKTPPISISGTGGEFLPEPAPKSLIVAKSKVAEGAPESRCSQVLPHSRYSR